MSIGDSAIRPATARTGAPARPASPAIQTVQKPSSQTIDKPTEDEDTKIIPATEPQAQKLVTSNSENSINAALNKRNSNYDFSAYALVGVLGALSLMGNFRQDFSPALANQTNQANPSSPVSRDQETKLDPMKRDDLISVPQTNSPVVQDSQRVALESNFTALINNPSYGNQFKEYFAENARMLRFEIKDDTYKMEDLSHMPNDKFAQSMMFALHAMEDEKITAPIFSRLTSFEPFYNDPKLVSNVFAYQEAKGGLALNPSRSLDIGFGDTSGIEF